MAGQEPAEDYVAQAQELLNLLTPAERIGQLFLVTFSGSEAFPESDITDLILTYKVGGVVLLDGNNNFGGPENTPAQVANLSNDLQRFALQGLASADPGEGDADVALPTVLPTGAQPRPARPVPLLIATIHEGDGPPFTELRQGVSQLPSQMAVGATWNPEFSQAMGRIAGRELAAVGVNMLLGPSLDVLEDPMPLNPSDLGVRTFGGDPFWVGLMGQAYISGAHEGSSGRLAVIAKHFPGYGSSDRPLNIEVGTVRKSLEQLKQIELAPFFAVTGQAPAAEQVADGLLTAHIRYQGFQGNIRDTTAPVSFDQQALASLMQLAEFQAWRQAGGILVSDSLGVTAVERFYDDTAQEFPHRQVAIDALLAGNDLLYLGSFGLGETDAATQLANIRDTITWFQERYESDQGFRQRIDDAVRRVLQLKLRLYSGNFEPQNVLVDLSQLAGALGQGQEQIYQVAQQAVTLLAPQSADLVNRLPPAAGDEIVVFTDMRESRQCADCPPEPWLARDAVASRLLALYGPQATGQVQPENVRSFSYSELELFLMGGAPSPAEPTPAATATPTATLEGPLPTPAPLATPTLAPEIAVGDALAEADWVIFAMLRPDADYPASEAVTQFLERRPDLARNARIIALAFNAPYYLDTTEISKLTAYFALYSRGEPFVDAAVRALFLDSPLPGRPPVNVEGIRYDLFEVTQPDPSQVLELFIVDDGELKSPPSAEPLEVVPGATLRLQTGVILDQNGNRIPDGTPVLFIQEDRIQGFRNVIAERPAIGGVANLDYLLEARAGNFRITVQAGQAQASQEVNIVIGESAVVSVNTPTPGPTLTIAPSTTPAPTETPTLAPSPAPTLTAAPSPTPGGSTSGDRPSADPASRAAILAAFTLGLSLTAAAGLALFRGQLPDTGRVLRGILWGVLGSLLAYNYFMLDLPGLGWLRPANGATGLLLALFGGAIGLGYGLIWRRTRLN
ncbi:MAG: glycoside hydrolase family 3 N-terminal domain-containing protein [Candidatus Promineifilaceae bacterium]